MGLHLLACYPKRFLVLLFFQFRQTSTIYYYTAEFEFIEFILANNVPLPNSDSPTSHPHGKALLSPAS